MATVICGPGVDDLSTLGLANGDTLSITSGSTDITSGLDLESASIYLSAIIVHPDYMGKIGSGGNPLRVRIEGEVSGVAPTIIYGASGGEMWYSSAGTENVSPQINCVGGGNFYLTNAAADDVVVKGGGSFTCYSNSNMTNFHLSGTAEAKIEHSDNVLTKAVVAGGRGLTLQRPTTTVRGLKGSIRINRTSANSDGPDIGSLLAHGANIAVEICGDITEQVEYYAGVLDFRKQQKDMSIAAYEADPNLPDLRKSFAGATISYTTDPVWLGNQTPEAVGSASLGGAGVGIGR